MRSILDPLRVSLKSAGWAVRQERQGALDENRVRQIEWRLESLRAPVGAVVELHLRVWVPQRGTYDYWGDWDDVLTATTVRFPQLFEDQLPGVEAHLIGDEGTRDDFRILKRALEWFRDPTSGEYWNEQLRADDWQPPTDWVDPRRSPVTLEQLWATRSDPVDMLRSLPEQPNERQLRLIACVCCRALPHDDRDIEAVESAERYAEGRSARRQMKSLCKHSSFPWLARLNSVPLAREAVQQVVELGQARAAADILRDILGNPYHRHSRRHEWMRNVGGAVGHLVEVIATEGRYEDMPILGDALDDAGCTVADILDHCRAPVGHVRGCWVVDLLRGR